MPLTSPSSKSQIHEKAGVRVWPDCPQKGAFLNLGLSCQTVVITLNSYLFLSGKTLGKSVKAAMLHPHYPLCIVSLALFLASPQLPMYSRLLGPFPRQPSAPAQTDHGLGNE